MSLMWTSPVRRAIGATSNDPAPGVHRRGGRAGGDRLWTLLAAGRLAVRAYHDPGAGWSADVPAGWTSVGLGPQLVRGQPLADPTRLLLRTYPNASPAAAQRGVVLDQGLVAVARTGERADGRLRWQRYRARKAGEPQLAVELAVAGDGAHAYVVALTARKTELGRLVRACLPLDSFAPGPPDRPDSVRAQPPRDNGHWCLRMTPWKTRYSRGPMAARIAAMRSGSLWVARPIRRFASPNDPTLRRRGEPRRRRRDRPVAPWRLA
jgi:hypothetical protein